MELEKNSTPPLPKATAPDGISSERLYSLIVKALREIFPDTTTFFKHPLTESEAAAIIGVRPQTLAVWRTKGTGPTYFKSGRVVRYRPQDIEEYLNSGLVRTD